MIESALRLRRAIHSSDTLLVQRILTTHPNLLQNPDFTPLGLSNTSLHLSSSLGHLPIVRLLLTLGADKTPAKLSLNENYETPLHLAARGGHTDVVHALCVACPWSIGRRDCRGRDALMVAAREGHDTVVQILITFSMAGEHGGSGKSGEKGEKGESVLDRSDNEGNTALHFASSNGHLLVLRTLLAAGAEPERRNVGRWTALNYSATVQAEVYFKALVSEVQRRDKVRAQAVSEKKGGAVRMIGVGDGEEL